MVSRESATGIPAGCDGVEVTPASYLTTTLILSPNAYSTLTIEMDAYSVQCPTDQSIHPDIVTFLQSFYSVSDTPGETEKYVDMFTEDATFVLASKKAAGHSEITTLRQGMWEAVASRKHQLFQIFPFGKGSDELMLYGTVALQLKNGGSAEIDWAARAELVRSAPDGKYRFKYYQVYLDTGAAAAYKK
ncbi:hypothetical protein CEP53_012486 [Fusarium sp. AF-6]|nr:hypothetical protein CEP53_012486 [Fusarium sp. AF-6]